MKKIHTVLLLCLCGIAVYGLGPEDFLGAWKMNALPGADSVFSCVQNLTVEGCSMVSKLDKSDLKVVDGPSGKKAIASDSSKPYVKIRRTPSSPSDTVFEYSIAIEFMIPDSLPEMGLGFWSMGNLYADGLEISLEGKIVEWRFLFKESPAVIQPDKWCQFVASVKAGHDSPNPEDTTGFLTLYFNGKKLADLGSDQGDPKKTFVSGGFYTPFHLLESINIDVATISYVALLNKTVDSAEVAQLQKDYFQTAIGERYKILHNSRTPVISTRQDRGGIYMQSDRINTGTVKILDFAGRTIYDLNMDKGRAFLPSRSLSSGMYVYTLITKHNEQYTGKLAVW